MMRVIFLALLMSGICTFSGAKADIIERPNKGKALYLTPWNDELNELKAKCNDLRFMLATDCRTLRWLTGHQHALRLRDVAPDKVLQYFHGALLEAQKTGQVPTIVLPPFPHEGCDALVRPSSRVTEEDYKVQLNLLAGAIEYYKHLPVNIVVGPWLSELIDRPNLLCDKQRKGTLLRQRIALIKTISNIYTATNPRTKQRANPNLRLFLSIGNPNTTPDATKSKAVIGALDEILRESVIDGVFVDGSGEHGFNEKVAWAKSLIHLLKWDVKRRLTIGVDTGCLVKQPSTGSVVTTSLEIEPLPTLDHPDRVVELVTTLRDPTGDSRNRGCWSEAPMDHFDLDALQQYLRALWQAHTPDEP